jgi:hypothetical protein
VLDLIKLAGQVSALSQHLRQEASISQERLQKALATYALVGSHLDRWQQRYRDWQHQLIFTTAAPLESLDQWMQQGFPPLQPQTGIHAVIATDGSQIVPNHHEIAYCSLINIGRVALHYGSQQRPLLDSVPVLFYRSGDLGASRGLGIEDLLSLRRTQSELEELVQLALQQSTDDQPTLALVDGSLIHWTLDALPLEDPEQWLAPILAAMDALRSARIPIAGYISASRSSEVVNFLRLGLCPFAECDCHRHCGEVATPPCNPFASLTDRVFWSALLQPGQRSPVFRSGARLLKHYGSHVIACCYLHVGEEIARIEFPLWVATDSTLLDQTLSMILAQVQKGFGYPVALAEAHHLAVVRGGDRQRFFALLEQELIRTGLTNVAVSRKEARKRGGIA